MGFMMKADFGLSITFRLEPNLTWIGLDDDRSGVVFWSSFSLLSSEIIELFISCPEQLNR